MDRRPILYSILLHVVVLTLLLVQVSFRRPQKVAPMIPLMVIPISEITASPRRAAPKQEMETPTPHQHAHTPPSPPATEPTPAAPAVIKKIEKPKDIKPLQTKKEKEESKKVMEKAKPKENDFEQLLKNLEKPVLKRTEHGTTKGPTIDSENIADKLSLSELDGLRQQLQRCWNIPAGARNAENLAIDARVTVGPDAIVQNVELMDQARMKQDPFYRAAAESAKRALYHPECTPLKLPANKYQQWKVFMITFDPQEILK